MATFHHTDQPQSIEQPQPLPSKRSYASFLEDFVDRPSSSPGPKRYRPESVDKFVTQWVESVSAEGDLISRELTNSVPNMGNDSDAEEFKKSTTPASATSRSVTQSVTPSDATSSAAPTDQSSTRLVSNSAYREFNLASNNIFMRSDWVQFPEHIQSLVDQVGRERGSPGPSAEAVWRDGDLEILGRGAAGSEVQSYFQTRVFPRSEGALKYSMKHLMAKHAVPNSGSPFRVSTPKPDLLIGYDSDKIIPQLRRLGFFAAEMAANVQSLVYPFFIIEFKGDGPSGVGSLWDGTNQCLGGAASSVNLAESLNDRLRQCESDEIQPINNAVFSIAMSGTEARLFISWKDDEVNYYLQDVKGFLLSDVDHYLLFRRYVRNIVDWGKDRRLADIRDSLDQLLEESRRASKVAKSPPPPLDTPSDEASTSSSKRTRNAETAI